MRVAGFSVLVDGGREIAGGYVEIDHRTQYTLLLFNSTNDDCDANVVIDGKPVGEWRISGSSSARIERPVNDMGRFTFYRLDTPDAAAAQIQATEEAGLISVTFKPGRLPDYEGPLFQQNGPPGGKRVEETRAGGTGLSGRSEQAFRTVDRLAYYPGQEVAVHLRLIATDNTPRPLEPVMTRSNPVPPPVWKKD